MSSNEFNRENHKYAEEAFNKGHESGSFEKYGETTYQYLRDKFPNEPNSAIMEAALCLTYEHGICLMGIKKRYDNELTKIYQKLIDLESKRQ